MGCNPTVDAWRTGLFHDGPGRLPMTRGVKRPSPDMHFHGVFLPVIPQGHSFSL
jgi:hypothetical protein